MERGADFTALSKIQYLYMMYVWGHSYEFNNDNNWELIEGFCQLVSGREDTWYATNIQIVDYMKAAKNLKFSVDGNMVYNMSATPVWLSVDGKLVEAAGGRMTEL
jgi:hypothetical protein